MGCEILGFRSTTDYYSEIPTHFHNTKMERQREDHKPVLLPYLHCLLMGRGTILVCFYLGLFLLAAVVVDRVQALVAPSQPSSLSSSSSAADMSSSNKPLVIFCHGSGDTGAGVAAWVQSLMPAAIYNQFRWTFPTARPIPYQLAGGAVSSVWYDRQGGFDPSYPEVTNTVEASVHQLVQVIKQELQNNPQLSARNIVIGGFSMGGNIAYQTAARWHADATTTTPLGAVFGLSCYLNHDSRAWSMMQQQQQAKSWPPTFVAHGAADDFILPAWGHDTYQRLVQTTGLAKNKSHFALYPDVQHEMVPREMADLVQFLHTHVVVKDKEEDASPSQSTTTTDKVCSSSSSTTTTTS